MKKMIYGTRMCNVSADTDCRVIGLEGSGYGRDAVCYAAERFLSHAVSYCRICTEESWQHRLTKGKKDRRRSFCYLIPAVLMELPGDWIRVQGEIDADGVQIRRIESVQAI